MTTADLKAALDVLRLSGRDLAGLLGCSRTLPDAWLAGRSPTPESVAGWLRAYAAAQTKLDARHPAPRDWRQRRRSGAA